MAGFRNLPNIHPIVVAFPIGLLPVALGFDLFGLLLRSEDILVAGRWALWLGTVGAAAAVATGFWGLDAVHPYVSDAAEALMTKHRNLQVVTLCTAVVLSAWRVAARGEPLPARGRVVYLLVTFATVANLIIASDIGAKLVRLHGVGVRVDADSLQGHQGSEPGPRDRLLGRNRQAAPAP